MKLIPEAMAQTEQTPPAVNAPAAPAPAAAPRARSRRQKSDDSHHAAARRPGRPAHAAGPSRPDRSGAGDHRHRLPHRHSPATAPPEGAANQLKNIRRGDTVVTASGFIGKVTKIIDDNEFEIEIATNVRSRMLRSAITEVRTKGEPVKETPAPKS